MPPRRNLPAIIRPAGAPPTGRPGRADSVVVLRMSKRPREVIERRLPPLGGVVGALGDLSFDTGDQRGADAAVGGRPFAALQPRLRPPGQVLGERAFEGTRAVEIHDGSPLTAALVRGAVLSAGRCSEGGVDTPPAA